MRVPKSARPLLAALADLVWPTPCFLCRQPLPLAQACGACLPCWARLTPLRGVCPRCGDAAWGVERAPGLPCARCLLARASGRAPAPTALDGVRPAVAYDAVARRFLLRAKAGGRRELLPLLGAQLAASVLSASFAAGCEAVVPVPSHVRARVRRGFCPAREIARPVAEALGLPCQGALGRRWSRGASAKRLSAPARARALEGAFVVRRGAVLPPRVLLVDDVMTTGATAASCARALRARGVREVRLAVWARTPLRPEV